jgi:hypothetical protein
MPRYDKKAFWYHLAILKSRHLGKERKVGKRKKKKSAEG